MSRPFLLLSNDDGVDAPGLLALRQALEVVGDVAVVAPEHNWSAAGHTKTMHKPLRVRPTRLADGSEALATSGSPSDCVAMVLLGLLGRTPELVISGINLGANVGHDLTYSGTVAAAMESVIGGVGAIAASLDTFEATDYAAAARFVAYLANRFLAYQHAAGQETQAAPLLLNVNIPTLLAENIKGVQVTRLGRRLYRDALIKREDPRGRAYYWIGGDPPGGVPEQGTDIGALAEGYISVTPILLDLTDEDHLSLIESWKLAYPPT